LRIKETKSKKASLSKIFDVFRQSDLSMLEIIPYKNITAEGYLIDRQNHYQCILKVETKDLLSLNSSDLKRLISQFTDLNRIYLENYKIISLTYSSETVEQRNFWKEKIKQHRKELENNPISALEKKQLQVKLSLAKDNFRRVKWVEESLEELSFFIIVYGDTQKEVETKAKEMTRLGGSILKLNRLLSSEVEVIVEKLLNMNSN